MVTAAPPRATRSTSALSRLRASLTCNGWEGMRNLVQQSWSSNKVPPGVGCEGARRMTSSIATILFTDVVDSTVLMQRLGDERAQRVFEGHQRMLMDTL